MDEATRRRAGLQKIRMRIWPIFTLAVMSAGCEKPNDDTWITPILSAVTKVDECKKSPLNSYELDSECIVWDLDQGRLHGAYEELPRSLRYAGGSDPVAVFFVARESRAEVGRDNGSDSPADLEFHHVSIVEMPGCVPVGTCQVTSFPPRSSRKGSNGPETGDSVIPIRNWILSAVAQSRRPGIFSMVFCTIFLWFGLIICILGLFFSYLPGKERRRLSLIPIVGGAALYWFASYINPWVNLPWR